MILASFYLADRFHLNTTAALRRSTRSSPGRHSGSRSIGIILFFIPAYLGIRFGTGFATVLALLSMIPLTFIAVAWIFNPWVVHFGELAGFNHVDGTSFFCSLSGFGWLTVYIAYSFLLTWNVIAMEAAACYIGECKHPERDAKIAMNLEGGYGLFIYSLIPIAFIVVLGAKALSNSALVDPKTIFVEFAGKIFGGTGGSLLNWLVAAMLVVALALSALNAIMGCARSLHQMSVDGQFPRWFSKINKHGVPDRAMFFNVICSLILILAGGAVQIYSFSNVGYVFSFIPVLVGYYLLRKTSRMRAGRSAAGVLQVRRARDRRPLRRDLDLRRDLLLEDRTYARLLPHRLGRPALVPAALLVPGEGRGQEGQAQHAHGAGDHSGELLTEVR